MFIRSESQIWEWIVRNTSAGNWPVGMKTGQLIRYHREANNVTLVELADRLCLSWERVNEMEKGLAPVSLDTVHRIARILGMNARQLMGGH